MVLNQNAYDFPSALPGSRRHDPALRKLTDEVAIEDGLVNSHWCRHAGVRIAQVLLEGFPTTIVRSHVSHRGRAGAMLGRPYLGQWMAKQPDVKPWGKWGAKTELSRGQAWRVEDSCPSRVWWHSTQPLSH